MRTFPAFTLAALFAVLAPIAAAERGTKQEARAMVAKAIVLMKADSVEKTYMNINGRSNPELRRGELYVFVFDFNGIMLATGDNLRMVGKDLSSMKDVDGTPLAGALIAMVKSKKRGWHGPYRFTNPQRKALKYKKSYCEQGVGETVVCCGIFLDDKKAMK